MVCAACGFDNRSGRKFCGGCGAPLQRACPKCEAPIESDERFCGECGAPLVDAAGLSDSFNRRTGSSQSTSFSRSGSFSGPQGRASRPDVSSFPSSIDGGRYEIRRFLGEGGRKRVYLARDQRLDRDVAIALIKTDGLDDSGVARARREAEAMGRLGDHPNIVTIYDIGEDGSQLFVVSQFMAGGDLEEQLRASHEHRLSTEEATRVGEQISCALEHAHAQEIVHRDVKPRNVWLTKDGVATLGDFGLAVALDRSRITLEGMMIGTVAYMPPEQGLGRPVDHRSDLYSLGALLYECVCGRPPFVGDDPVAIISQHINTAPVAPSWHNPEVSRPLEELILSLLAKSPDERPRSATAVRQALSAIATGDLTGTEPIVHDRASPLDRLATGVFVGRERETADLRAALEAVLSGRGRLTLVSGEMGIGKTRIASELATYASLRGAQVLWGRCREDDGVPAFWPWVQILRSLTVTRDAEAMAAEMGSGAVDIAQIVPDVRTRLPGLPPAQQSEPEQARFKLFDAITTFLKNVSTSEPVVLILDDLQWADRASLLLLEYLVGELDGSRILVVATYRDSDVDRSQQLSDALADLRRERNAKRMTLRGLSAEETRRWLEAVAEHELAGRELRLTEQLHRETQGNPFFIEEIIRHFVETGLLVRRDERWVSTVDSIEDLGIPEGIRETIDRRLARLPQETGQVLTVGAVVGHEFSLDVVREVSDLDATAVLDALDAAIADRIIAEVPGSVGRFRFVHGLTREALYSHLGTTVKVRMHNKVGEAIERLHSTDLRAHVGELAYHFGEALLIAGPQKATEYATAAARRATEMVAYEDAATHLRRALQTASSDDARIDLEYELGTSLWSTGDFDGARAAFQASAELARGAGAIDRLARAGLGYGGQLGFGTGLRDEALIGMLEGALAGLAESDEAVRAKVMSRLAEALTFGGEPRRREELCAEAEAIGRRLGDPAVLAYVLSGRHYATYQPANAEARLAMADEQVAAAHRAGDAGLELAGRIWRAWDLLDLGRMTEMDEEIERCRRIAEPRRQSYEIWLVEILRTMSVIGSGTVADAERAIDATLELGQRAANANSLQLWGAQMAQVRRHQGRFGELEDGIKLFIAEYPMIPAWRAALCDVYCETGDTEQARLEFEIVAADDFATLPRDPFWLVAMALSAQTASFLKDERRAQFIYDRLLPFDEHNISIGPSACWGTVCYSLGLLAETLGRTDDARRHLHRAIELNTERRFHALLARTQYDLARVLVDADVADERQQVLNLLASAMDLAQRYRVPRVTDLALALKLRIQGVESIDARASIARLVWSITEERPDLRSHASPDGTVTVLFSDIENSTMMTEQLGDRSWFELLNAHNAIIRQATARCGGFEVKSQGDGFMLAFSSAMKALECAVGIQRDLAEFRASHPDTPVHVRIGLHTGEAIKDADDFFGKNVILAARIAGQAKGGEILASSVVRELTVASGDVVFDEGRDVELKGLTGSHRIYTTIWADD